jgi:precorrin-6B methylase 2
MSRFYSFAYAVGFRPWERAGRAGTEQLRSLLATTENGGPSHGVALDIGCGTGAHTIELARRGWQAIGIDNQPKAIRLAREQAQTEQSSATFEEADVTALRDTRLPEDVRLFLDIGCGTGAHTIELARRSWQAIGIDNQPKAIRLAREHAQTEQSSATFEEADVTALRDTRLPEDVRLFLDIGCFHDLPPEGRRAMAEGVTALAARDATLLLLAFQPGKRGPLPRGADQEELEKTFDGWKTVDTVPAVTDGMPRPLRKAAPTWYRMQRT